MFAFLRARARPRPPKSAPVLAVLGAPARAVASGLERLEAAMLEAPQIPLGFRHHFAPGVYAREMIAPAGCDVLGHAHKTACLNIVLEGIAIVREGETGPERIVKAGDVFVSAPGVRKLGRVVSDLRFLNVHPNPSDTRDLAALEAAFVEPSETFRRHSALESVELRTLKTSATPEASA